MLILGYLEGQPLAWVCFTVAGKTVPGNRILAFSFSPLEVMSGKCSWSNRSIRRYRLVHWRTLFTQFKIQVRSRARKPRFLGAFRTYRQRFELSLACCLVFLQEFQYLARTGKSVRKHRMVTCYCRPSTGKQILAFRTSRGPWKNTCIAFWFKYFSKDRNNI